MCQKAEHTQPVVRCHDNDALLGIPLAIGPGLCPGAGREATAVDDHQHRQRRIGVGGGLMRSLRLTSGPPNISPCMQCGLQVSARNTPSQGITGCGGRQRRAPTGGAAKGMPLNRCTPDSERVVPSTRPPVIPSRAAAEHEAAKQVATHSVTAVRNVPAFTGMPLLCLNANSNIAPVYPLLELLPAAAESLAGVTSSSIDRM